MQKHATASLSKLFLLQSKQHFCKAAFHSQCIFLGRRKSLTKRVLAAAEQQNNVIGGSEFADKPELEKKLNATLAKCISEAKIRDALAAVKYFFAAQCQVRPNIYLINNLLLLLKQKQAYTEMMQLFHIVRDSGILKMDKYHLSIILNVLSKAQLLQDATVVFLEMRKDLILPDAVTMAAYLTCLCQANMTQRADRLIREFFAQYGKDDLVFAPVIASYAKLEQPQEAFELIQFMMEHDIVPNDKTLQVAYQICMRKYKQELLTKLNTLIKKAKPSGNDAKLLIDSIVLEEKIIHSISDAVTSLVQQKMQPRADIYQQLFEKIAKKKESEKAFQVYHYFITQYPDMPSDTSVTFPLLNMLLATQHLFEAESVFIELKQNPKVDTLSLYNFVLPLLAKHNYWEQVTKYYNLALVQEKFIATKPMFTAHLLCQIKLLQWKTVQDICVMCQKNGYKLSELDFGSVLRLLLLQGKFTEMVQVLEQVKEEGVTIADQELYNVLIAITQQYMTADVEQVKVLLGKVKEFFTDMTGAQPYGALVNAYIKYGCTKDALFLMVQMDKLRLPVSISTVNNLMLAYSKKQEIEQAMIIYRQMSNLGLEPDMYTYSILIQGIAELEKPSEQQKQDAQALYEAAKSQKLHFNGYLLQGMVKLYAKEALSQPLTTLLADDQILAVCSDSTLNLACRALVEKHDMAQAESLLTRMQRAGKQASSSTIQTLVKLLVMKRETLERAEQLVKTVANPSSHMLVMLAQAFEHYGMPSQAIVYKSKLQELMNRANDAQYAPSIKV